MLSRLSSAALSGTRIDRKTSINRTNDKADHGGDEQRQAGRHAIADVAERGGLTTHMGSGCGPIEDRGEHVGAKSLDGGPSRIVLWSRRCEGDDGRDASSLVDLGRRHSGDTGVVRNGGNERFDDRPVG